MFENFEILGVLIDFVFSNWFFEWFWFMLLKSFLKSSSKLKNP